MKQEWQDFYEILVFLIGCEVSRLDRSIKKIIKKFISKTKTNEKLTFLKNGYRHKHI